MDAIISARYIASFHEDQPVVYENGMIAIEHDTITAVGKNLDTSGKDIFEFPNHIVIPGLINTHTHAAMTLFRGYADDIPLQNWLNDHIWPLEAKLTPDQVYMGAKLAAVEAMMSGCTTLNSMYWHPESEAKAFDEQGVRLMVGAPLISGVNTIDIFDSMVMDWHEKAGDMTRVALTPHAPYSVTAEDYQSVQQYKMKYNADPNNKPISVHTHIAEDKNEMELITNLSQRFGFELPRGSTTPTQYLSQLGVLDEAVVAAHCIEMTSEDIQTISRKKVGVATNSVSNMKLGNGLPKIAEMLEYTTKIGVGTDGPCSNNGMDLFESMKITAITQKSVQSNPTILPAWATLKMATYGGAKVLNWNGSIGSIQPGKKADLAIVDLNKLHFYPRLNAQTILSHLVYSGSGNDVSDVMINGQWKMRGREVQQGNLGDLMREFEDTVFDLINS
ncbi:MAG: amidohydrolase [Candidatus Kariarchaeaceae archaeon]|jgi:5-methylthioadenosine/S-adenosylhomocysteine deaminase